MKNDELFDKHADNRKSKKGKKKTFAKNEEPSARAQRVSFKNYIREVEESLLDLSDYEDLDD